MSQSNLTQVMADHARRVSDVRLACDLGAGVAGITLVLLLRAEWWPLALPFVSLGAIGAWGMAERSRPGTVRARRLLAGARVAAAVLGFAAAIAFALVVFGSIFTNWIL
jgi:hypothetical protein